MRKLIYASVLTISLAACGGNTEPEIEASKVPTHLNGNWNATSLVMGGNELPAEMTKEISITINNLTYETRAMGQKETGTMVYHDDHTPLRLDIMPKNGPMAGNTLKAIYKLEGEKLTVAYNTTSEDYPSGFYSNAENGYLVTVYTR